MSNDCLLLTLLLSELRLVTHNMLTDTAIRNAKIADKDYSLADAVGLRLLVRSSGAKLWQYRYRLAGKASIFSIGAYPAVKLSDARKAAAEAREQVARGINPAQARKTLQLTQNQELATTFQGVSEEWIALKKWGGRHTICAKLPVFSQVMSIL